MGMTIDKSTEVLEDYIDTYKVCGGNGYNPATNITQEACEAFETAVNVMRKYQKIAYLINQAEYAGENSYTGEGEWILADKAYQKIQEILKDGNDDN